MIKLKNLFLIKFCLFLALMTALLNANDRAVYGFSISSLNASTVKKQN